MGRRAKVTARGTGRPVIPQAIEIDEDHILLQQDGTVRPSYNVVLTEEQIGRMRAGYLCALCYEDLDTAWPDECPCCGFAIREKQAEKFEKEFLGTTWVGPKTTLDEEREIMNEMRERAQAMRKSTIQIVRPQIIVPRSIT